MAVTVNIDSQIVVKTAAQWAADLTVYSAQRILITSDETYTGTDQRKFKIANGTDTWSNLDYFPVGGSVSWGGITGTLSDQTDLQSELDNKLTGGEGATVGLFQSNGDNLGSSLLVGTDANKKFITLPTSIYPDLTELSYVKGVTSAIQTQLNGKSTLDDVIFTVFALYGGTTPLTDGSVWHFSNGANTPTAGNTAANNDSIMPYACTLQAAVIVVSANTTAGTNENILWELLNVTQNTTGTIGNVQSNGASTTVMVPFSFTGLSLPFAAGDTWALRCTNPTWATNPVGANFRVLLFFKRV